MKYAWIEGNRDRFPVGRMCVLLGVSRSGFYDWLGRTPSSSAAAATSAWRWSCAPATRGTVASTVGRG
ncbi:MAG: hypothetical protein MZW92_24405 [Comamonadaceae bacterium]|nr:hypothetical protein [Comamonadaceae bacterium]